MNTEPIGTTSELVLLMIYKDDLPSSGEHGFPLVTESSSIEMHLAVMQEQQKSEIPLRQQLVLPLPLDEVSSIKVPEVPEVPDNCFVWGWWRKPWEKHPKLLHHFAERCAKGENPDVLLYNRYLRRIYIAKLHGLHYIPDASTVEIPPSWSYKCPEYYSTKPHLCGAYFLLEILKDKKDKPIKLTPKEVFQQYYIDSRSFYFDSLTELAIISPPEEIVEICSNIIDKRPDPHHFLMSQHSMFALRTLTQKELTKKLISESASDKIVADAINRMVWSDVKWLIKDWNIEEWKKIFQMKESITATANIANKSSGKFVRFDLYLVAWTLANYSLFEDLFSDDKEYPNLSEVGLILTRWLTTEGIFEQRELASHFFAKVWKYISERYKLLDFSDYFDKLPEFEEIAYSTKYGIDRKFYRDHLNHNIRAALLSAFLTDVFHSKMNEDARGYNRIFVAFLGGLLHDIALPLSSYENTNQTLQKALQPLGITRESRIASLIDRSKLKDSLTTVALLASLPNLEKLQTNRVLFPWGQRDEILDIANTRILFEEMICSMSDEHAILGAAIIFNAAAIKRGGSKGNFDVGMRQIIQAGSGEVRTPQGLEFLNLIQSIALHDRKAASKYESAREEQPGVPTSLVFHDFPVPTIVAIADDLQEWGRPIGKFDETIVTDSQISFTNGAIDVSYDLSFKETAVGDAPYSFLEHIFGKIRNLSRIKMQKNSEHSLEINLTLNIVFGEIKLCYVGGSPSRIELLSDGDSQVIIWRKNDYPKSLEMGKERELYAIEQSRIFDNHSKHIAGDFLIIKGDQNLRDELKILTRGGAKIISFKTNGNDVEIKTAKHLFQGKILIYYFSKLSNKTVAGAPEKIRFENKIGVLEMELLNIETVTQTGLAMKEVDKTLQEMPHEHFLDFDWRFNWATCQGILKFVSHYCDTENKLVGYLGCPSLALYHHTERLSADWRLIDKGHYSIETWSKRGLLDPNKIIKYNVKDDLDRMGLTHLFDMIIMDPPWYEEYYYPFWKRALELIKPGGIIGLSEYPGYDPNKIKKFSDLRNRLIERIGEKDFFASLEISYSIPAFESFWDKQLQFTYPALNAYRPAYMDFYHIENLGSNISKSIRLPEDILPQIQELENGHYLRCLKTLNFARLSKKGITIKTRKTLARYTGAPKNIIAWSTNNTLVIEASNGEGKQIRSYKDLKEIVIAFEKRNA